MYNMLGNNMLLFRSLFSEGQEKTGERVGRKPVCAFFVCCCSKSLSGLYSGGVSGNSVSSGSGVSGENLLCSSQRIAVNGSLGLFALTARHYRHAQNNSSK